jgi:endo-1,4-beta-D-glucanase Y
MRIFSRLLILFLGFFAIYSCAAGGGSGDSNGGSGNGSCQLGTSACGNQCVNLGTDRFNCGSCGSMCSGDQTCSGGQCSCVAPLSACNSGCVNFSSDGNNCGSCGHVCAAGQVCSQSTCSSSCRTGEAVCGNSCVNTTSDPTNCGACGTRCSGGQACTNGSCACGGGLLSCSGQCVDVTSSVQNCGACGHVCSAGQSCVASQCTGGGGVTTGTGGAGGSAGATGTGTGGTVTTGTGGNRDAGTVGGGLGPEAGAPPARAGCPLTPGLIADFEEGAGSPAGVSQEGHTSSWEVFHDTAAGATETVTVESSGGTANCDQWALHVSGGGFASFAGFGVNMAGTLMAPQAYNATSHQFTGIRFKAKTGPTQDTKAAVRFNISTPATEGVANPGGSCADAAATVNTAALPCFQHPGKYLSVIPADNDLTSTWKTFTYCFDRDLYPQSLPSNMTNAQRDSVGSNILKVQFAFNAGNDYSLTTYPAMGAYPAIAKTSKFDFWVDQIELTTGACPTTATFTSTAGTAKPFPQNAALGTCAPATNAALYNAAIGKAYTTWKSRFVQGSQIIAPEQTGVTTSEAMGYGLMIAAAVGDQATFDQFKTYVQGHLDGNGLMTWTNQGGSGSATDADGDIIYAYLMANKQWPTGGYMALATPMIAAYTTKDAAGGLQSGDSPLGSTNPSYFAPYAYRAFGGLAALITSGYSFVNANVAASTAGIPTDWTTLAGVPLPANQTGAQVVNLLSTTEAVYGYDAARVPWRLGMDKCLNAGADTTALNSIVGFFSSKYGMGAQIDLLKAGWHKSNGTPFATAANMQGSYIGPMGVAGMAMNNAAMRDRAFRAMLDILESPQFNHTYFPSTVGLITALVMSGNFPTP